jgi:DNA-binding CsgD family transcriptional regulator
MSSNNHPVEDSLLENGDLDGVLLSGLDLIPQAVWVTDTHGRIRWVNRASVALFGSRRATHFSCFIAPEHLNGTRASFARNVLEVVDTTVLNTVLVGLFGRFAAELTSVLLRRDGIVVGVLFIVRSEPELRLESGPARLPRPNLTPRQYEVLVLLAEGLPTEQIAQRLQVAENTARNHIRLLLQEIGVHSRLAAVVTAYRNGWL